MKTRFIKKFDTWASLIENVKNVSKSVLDSIGGNVDGYIEYWEGNLVCPPRQASYGSFEEYADGVLAKTRRIKAQHDIGDNTEWQTAFLMNDGSIMRPSFWNIFGYFTWAITPNLTVTIEWYRSGTVTNNCEEQGWEAIAPIDFLPSVDGRVIYTRNDSLTDWVAQTAL